MFITRPILPLLLRIPLYRVKWGLDQRMYGAGVFQSIFYSVAGKQDFHILLSLQAKSRIYINSRYKQSTNCSQNTLSHTFVAGDGSWTMQRVYQRISHPAMTPRWYFPLAIADTLPWPAELMLMVLIRSCHDLAMIFKFGIISSYQ